MRKTVDTIDGLEATVPEGEDVIEAMHSLMHLYRAEQYRPRDVAGLAQTDGKVLRFFATHPGSTLKELGIAFSRDKGQLARVIASLRERGLLAARPHETDRRHVRLELTPQGRTAQQALRRRTHKLAESAVARLTPDEKRQLLALLQKVGATLQDISTRSARNDGE